MPDLSGVNANGPGSYSELPTSDIDVVKHHIKIRREAVQKMMTEISKLSEILKELMGPVEYLGYMASVAASEGDIFGREYKDGSD